MIAQTVVKSVTSYELNMSCSGQFQSIRDNSPAGAIEQKDVLVNEAEKRNERAISRRKFLGAIGAVSGAVAASSLLAACGDDDPPPPTQSTSSPTPESSPEGEQEHDETATHAVEEEAEATATTEDDPEPGAQSSGSITIAAPNDRHQPSSILSNIGMSIPNPSIYETLVALTPLFETEPRLAESWELIEPNTWRFNLRQDVVFHDGTPFTAEAVAWTFARVAESGGGTLLLGEDSVEIIDDYTVEVTPAEPNILLPMQLAAPRTGSIMAPGSSNADARVGTGPFREVEYVAGEHHIVEAFPDYWGGAPGLQQITFRYMPDPTTRMLAIQAGEVDLVFDVPREVAVQIDGMSRVRLVTTDVGAYSALSFNIHGEPPFDLGQDPVIREAVSSAINRDEIIAAAWQGNAIANNTMVPEGVLGSAAELVNGPLYDPDYARQILDEAGWSEGTDGIREKDGRRLRLDMVVGFPSAEIHMPMPEFVQAHLREIGIEIEIVLTPDTGIYGARLEAKEGDLWAEVGNQVDADPCYLPGSLYYSPGEDSTNAYANAFAPGPEFDSFIDACRVATSIGDAQEAAANAMSVLIDQEHVVIPIAGVIRLYAVRDRVQNFNPHPVQFVERWEHVTVSPG